MPPFFFYPFCTVQRLLLGHCGRVLVLHCIVSYCCHLKFGCEKLWSPALGRQDEMQPAGCHCSFTPQSHLTAFRLGCEVTGGDSETSHFQSSMALASQKSFPAVWIFTLWPVFKPNICRALAFCGFWRAKYCCREVLKQFPPPNWCQILVLKQLVPTLLLIVLYTFVFLSFYLQADAWCPSHFSYLLVF